MEIRTARSLGDLSKGSRLGGFPYFCQGSFRSCEKMKVLETWKSEQLEISILFQRSSRSCELGMTSIY